MPLLFCLLIGLGCLGTSDALFEGAGDPSDQVAPTFRGLTQAKADTPYSLRLSWSQASDDISRARDIEYRAFLAETSGAQDFGKPKSAIVGTSSGLVGGLRPGGRYFVIVRAVDRAGNMDKNTVEKSVTLPTSPTVARSFTMDVAPLLKRSCNEQGCHNSPTFIEGMDLTMPVSAYTALYDRSSHERPELKRVAPSDSGQSYMIRKVLGYLAPRSDGNQMPPPPMFMLSDDEISTIREWIDQGAKNN